MEKEFRFGIVGCGGISKVHIEQIKEIGNATIVAVTDVSEQNAKRVGDELGVDWYTDYHEMLKRQDIDIVNVVTPTGTHAEISVAAARAGKHIIVEKPIDTTIEKAEWAVTECRKAGVKLSVICQHRFDDSTIRIKQELASERFGKIFMANASINWYRAQSYFERSPGCGTWEMDGGGVLMIQALHTIDLLQYLIGPVKSVYTHTATATHERIEVEDVAAVTVKFENGAIGTISATTSAYPGLPTRLEVFGNLGTAVVENDLLTHLYFRTEDEPGEMFGGDGVNLGCIGNNNLIKTGLSHRRQIKDVIDAIQNEREPLVNGEESLRVLRLILAMYESARKNEPVFL